MNENMNENLKDEKVVTAESANEDASEKKSFADTATAAKLSGTFNVAAGKVKRVVAEAFDDAEMRNEARTQVLKGKLHSCVGSIRKTKEQASERYESTKKETKEICIKHAGRLLDLATDFIEDMRKALFK